jgi:hypothetical protein
VSGSASSSAPAGRWDYDGRDFGPAEPAAGAVIGHYHQHQDLVTADFSGDSVLAGRLVGIVDEHGIIDAAYCQIMRDGEAVAGRCVSTPTVLTDGRIQLTEQWHRIDGSSGVSQIVEIARGSADAAAAGVPRSTEGAS